MLSTFTVTSPMLKVGSMDVKMTGKYCVALRCAKAPMAGADEAMETVAVLLATLLSVGDEDKRLVVATIGPVGASTKSGTLSVAVALAARLGIVHW